MGWKERQVIEHEGEIYIGGARERLAEKLERLAAGRSCNGAGGDS